ncbi:expressed protein [Echinococcus multilocularis]|uniref:Expressed protein n=1 Tax=Echinococcus multilocularis TaxID=6211 RepID=A0A087VYE2_ECHMU|nr:expressed protein [Echinococcus multilocularis]
MKFMQHISHGLYKAQKRNILSFLVCVVSRKQRFVEAAWIQNNKDTKHEKEREISKKRKLDEKEEGKWSTE